LVVYFAQYFYFVIIVKKSQQKVLRFCQ
jgi:hypothetical protein